MAQFSYVVTSGKIHLQKQNTRLISACSCKYYLTAAPVFALNAYNYFVPRESHKHLVQNITPFSG